MAASEHRGACEDLARLLGQLARQCAASRGAVEVLDPTPPPVFRKPPTPLPQPRDPLRRVRR